MTALALLLLIASLGYFIYKLAELASQPPPTRAAQTEPPPSASFDPEGVLQAADRLRKLDYELREAQVDFELRSAAARVRRQLAKEQAEPEAGQ